MAGAERRTKTAEQSVTFELVREIAPLITAETTPPTCGGEERAGCGSCVTVDEGWLGAHWPSNPSRRS